MDPPNPLRLDRALVFPFFVAFFPMIWFVYRDSGVRVEDGQRVMTSLSRTLTLAAVAVVASYIIAVMVVAVINSRDNLSSPWFDVFLRPSNRTLLILAGLWSTIPAYIAIESIMDSSPFWSELVIGIPLLWPLLLTIIVTYAIGNAYPLLQAFSVQATLAVVGLALSAVWIFLLSSGIDRIVSTRF